jgi:choice-of-anchor A domain-containing protein
MSNLSRKQRLPSKLNLLALEERINPTPAPDACIGLGIARDYNAIVFDDFHATYTETEGRLAIGGDASLTGYGVGVRLTDSDGQRDDLIVGGNLNYQHGQSFSGNIVYGGSANLTSIGTPNGSVRQGNVIDFAAAKADLVDRSIQFSQLPTNGTSVKQWGNLTLTGTNAERNVFSLSAADFENTWSLTVNVPTNSVVIINVFGSFVNMKYFGIQLNGTTANKVLFNFPNTETLNIEGIGIEGSVLAPKAKVNFNNGAIRGTLVADSFFGTGEIRHVRPDLCVDKPEAKAMLSGVVCETPDCPPGYTGPKANVQVILSGTTAGGSVNKTTMTNSNGQFSFGDLAPGTYTVSVTVPSGYVTGTAELGNGGGSVVNGTTISSITLGDGSNAGNYKFTLVKQYEYAAPAPTPAPAPAPTPAPTPPADVVDAVSVKTVTVAPVVAPVQVATNTPTPYYTVRKRR